MAANTRTIIIGQEVICPDGLGRVVDYSNKNLGYIASDDWVIVETYYSDKDDENEFKWPATDIELIDPRK